MLSRSAQNWNQEFTFDSELAEISGGTKSGDPPFPFFPPVHPCRLHRCHTFIPRALTHACRELKARGDEENKEKEVATVYHHQVDGYPDDILLFIVTEIQIYIYIYISITFLLL